MAYLPTTKIMPKDSLSTKHCLSGDSASSRRPQRQPQLRLLGSGIRSDLWRWAGHHRVHHGPVPGRGNECCPCAAKGPQPGRLSQSCAACQACPLCPPLPGGGQACVALEPTDELSVTAGVGAARGGHRWAATVWCLAARRVLRWAVRSSCSKADSLLVAHRCSWQCPRTQP